MIDNCAFWRIFSIQSLTVNTLLGCFLPRLSRAMSAVFFARTSADARKARQIQEYKLES